MKTESLKEYLTRGGTIKKLLPGDKSKEQNVKSSAGGPATLFTLEEGELFYGERKPKKEGKKPKQPKVNLNDIPEPLRLKYLARLNGNGEEG